MEEIKEEEEEVKIKQKKKRLNLRGINADEKPYTKAEQDEWNEILAEHRKAVLEDHPDWFDDDVNVPAAAKFETAQVNLLAI